jgi:hypothetical protein
MVVVTVIVLDAAVSLVTVDLPTISEPQIRSGSDLASDGFVLISDQSRSQQRNSWDRVFEIPILIVSPVLFSINSTGLGSLRRPRQPEQEVAESVVH